MILVAHVFDVLDGRIARLTRTVELASASSTTRSSDLVAFGVAPGILVYRWALEPWGRWGWLAASLYVTCGALRLARFNVQFDIGREAPLRRAADSGRRRRHRVDRAALLLLRRRRGDAQAHHRCCS